MSHAHQSLEIPQDYRKNFGQQVGSLTGRNVESVVATAFQQKHNYNAYFSDPKLKQLTNQGRKIFDELIAAKKLKNMGIAKEVYGFALVGSLKGFEMIREV